MSEIVIIGGGVAGLGAANYLVDQGINPILIEADTIGRNKVCGECFSPEAVSILKKWELPILPHHEVHFYSRHGDYQFDFEHNSASLPRAKIETHLADRAYALGTTILENAKIQDFQIPTHHKANYKILLANGTELNPRKVIIAAGRFYSGNQTPTIVPQYYGIKAHFSDVTIPEKLHLFLTPGAYTGAIYVEPNLVNICSLTRIENLKAAGDAAKFMETVAETIPSFGKILHQGKLMDPNWLEVPIVGFGKKTVPSWPNSFFVGDAAATIAPASGNGLAMGLTSGMMGAEFALHNTDIAYRKAWHMRYAERLNWANLLNTIYLNPTLAKYGFSLAKACPLFPRILYKRTRDKK